MVTELLVTGVVGFIGLGFASAGGRVPPKGCAVVDPAGVSKASTKVDSTVLTVTQPEWAKTFVAGQAVWVVLKNPNIHLTPVDVRFQDEEIDPRTGAKSKRIVCESRIVVPPSGTVVVKETMFGKKIPWDLRTALPNEPPLDSALVNVTVMALPPSQ